MSSVTRTTQQSSEPTAKKKFGKNLNKLTKPPAPPVSSGVKSTASSRNGLLLLSTKRLASGTNAVAAGSVGGILSSKPSQTTAKALPSLGLQYESNTSTHDALLGAVVGASRSESQQQPDAWGVAEKNQKGHGEDANLGQMEKLPEPSLTPNGGVSSLNHPYPDNGIRYKDMDPAYARYDQVGRNGMQYDMPPQGNWDDYGGRQPQGDSRDATYIQSDFQPAIENEESEDNVQGVFMSRLARERAEKRRTEEEARFVGQKERAAQRLRELEQKLTTPAPSDPVHENGVSKQGRSSDGTGGGHSPKSQVVLEKLSRTGNSQGGTSPHHGSVSSGGDRGGNGVVRTLYDPSRTYSSLVGGGAGKNEKGGESRNGISEAANHPRNARGTGSPYMTAQENPNQPFSDRDSQYNRQVIHLSSYEDRDRGERGAGAGPRMLFDPKSGSMVAVPTRDETAAGGRGRKDRNKKGRNGRDKDTHQSKSDSRQDNAASDGTKSGRKGKGRKDENGISQRGRSVADTTSPSKAELKKGRVPNSERRLPRTSGVLYARDEKGSCYCADGCDGDLGYGAHSVPGGRTRNPDAYSKYMEDQKQLFHQQEPSQLEEKMLDSHYDAELNHLETSNVTLQTGFSVREPKEPKLDWVKPNEKIVLVTGVDDSPTLQATAKEWAPSQAALAAAAAAVEQEKSTLPLSVASQEEDEDSDDDGPFGLGFDPTLHMDSMMQSPSAEPTSSLDAVDLASLSLEPALNPATSRHIFAFESGATWGNTPGNHDWGVPAGGHAFSTDGSDKAVSAATFLSLSSTNTWGAAAVSGLGGTPFGGSSLNGDPARSTAD